MKKYIQYSILVLLTFLFCGCEDPSINFASTDELSTDPGIENISPEVAIVTDEADTDQSETEEEVIEEVEIVKDDVTETDEHENEEEDPEDMELEIVKDELVTDNDEEHNDNTEETQDESQNNNSDNDNDEVANEPSDKCRINKSNLIVNGSFEMSDHREGSIFGKKLLNIVKSGWDVFDGLPATNKKSDAWVVTNGAGVEVHGHSTVVKSHHGKRSIELDSHGKNSNSSITQEVELCKGKYILKFQYYARTKKQNDNIISVYINDKKIKEVNEVHNGKWRMVRRSFHVKKAGTYKITFAAEGIENTLGGIIDHVRLRKHIRRAGVVTSLIALGDQDNMESPLIADTIAKSIILKSVNFASMKRKPRIMMVKDLGHNNESLNDFMLILDILTEKYGDDAIEIIEGDLYLDDVEKADLIYVINPGYPLKSEITANTIREVKKSGKIGIIMSGDDMSRGANFKLDDITGAEYKNNGTSACGVKINNNNGEHFYDVKLKKRYFKKLDKKERYMSYGNDIDHVKITRKGMNVLASAHVEKCDLKIPVVFGYKLKMKTSKVDKTKDKEMDNENSEEIKDSKDDSKERPKKKKNKKRTAEKES